MVHKHHAGKDEVQKQSVVYDDAEVFKSRQWEEFVTNYPEYKLPVHGNDIFVDAHVLATPVLADIDADGNTDLVVPVSYYFDECAQSVFILFLTIMTHDTRVARTSAERLALYPPGTDLSKYVACGIVVFDLVTQEIKWTLRVYFSTQ